jgi:MFS family permease
MRLSEIESPKQYDARVFVVDRCAPFRRMRLMNVLFVALGGAIGSAARYLVGALIADRFGPDFPWGTFIVNVSGSFLIGVILSFVGGGQLPAGARPFLAVGVMGGIRRSPPTTTRLCSSFRAGSLGRPRSTLSVRSSRVSSAYILE